MLQKRDLHMSWPQNRPFFTQDWWSFVCGPHNKREWKQNKTNFFVGCENNFGNPYWNVEIGWNFFCVLDLQQATIIFWDCANQCETTKRTQTAQTQTHCPHALFWQKLRETKTPSVGIDSQLHAANTSNDMRPNWRWPDIGNHQPNIERNQTLVIVLKLKTNKQTNNKNCSPWSKCI